MTADTRVANRSHYFQILLEMDQACNLVEQGLAVVQARGEITVSNGCSPWGEYLIGDFPPPVLVVDCYQFKIIKPKLL